jgi:hypothetical protein
MKENLVFLPSIRRVDRAAWKVMRVSVYAWESLGLVLFRVRCDDHYKKKSLMATYNATVLTANVKGKRNCEDYQGYIHQRANSVKGLSQVGGHCRDCVKIFWYDCRAWLGTAGCSSTRMTCRKVRESTMEDEQGAGLQERARQNLLKGLMTTMQ